MIYRTAKCHQYEPLVDNEFPQYLTSFAESEAKWVKEKDPFTLSPLTSKCKCGCPRGLSFFTSNAWHEDSTIQHAIGISAISNSGLFSMKYIEDNAERESFIRNKRKGAFKILPFVCYEYDVKKYLSSDDFGIIHDGNLCEDSPKPEHHVTLFPRRKISACVAVLSSKEYAFCPALQYGWTAHCIQLVAQAEPKSALHIYDPKWLRVAWTIYRSMSCFQDLSTVLVLASVLKTLEDYDYCVVGFKQNSGPELNRMIYALQEMNHFIQDFVQTVEVCALVRELEATVKLRMSPM